MCATWWRGYQRSARETSVTIGKVCHRKVNVYTFLYRRKRFLLVLSSRPKDPSTPRFFVFFRIRFFLPVSTVLPWTFASTLLANKEREFFPLLPPSQIFFSSWTRSFLQRILICLSCSLERINYDRKSMSLYGVTRSFFIVFLWNCRIEKLKKVEKLNLRWSMYFMSLSNVQALKSVWKKYTY